MNNDLEDLFLYKKIIINTINSHSYVMAKSDKRFRMALQNSDILLPDGIGIVLATKLINKEKISKISGTDLHYYLLNILNKESGSIFYMGSTEDILFKIQKKLSIEFPNINMKFYSPPFKSELSDTDSELIISRINSFSPDVLFIGMTAPKQEKWLYKYKDKLNFRIGSSIGAAFDFYAETIVRPSNFWIDLHLEWLLRLLKDPKRLWRRSFVSAPLFVLDVILYKIRWKK